MKKVTFLILSLIAVCGNYAQSNLLADNVKKESVSWDKTTLDFGKTTVGEKVEAKFIYTNNSETPVVLNSVKPSCGCTNVHYKKTAIQPGEKAEVSASYTPKKDGYFQKSITVVSSATETPVVLRFNGEGI